MKATGIVRRIDDLGRVVIPKEIRRTLRIKEGTPLEIFTDKEGEIILKKFLPKNMPRHWLRRQEWSHVSQTMIRWWQQQGREAENLPVRRSAGNWTE